MRKKVRKSLAFLLALALVVSVMSGLGLSVSADDAQNESVVTETEGEPAEEKPKAEESTPAEGGKEEKDADPDAEAVPEEKKDEQKAEGEGSGDDVKDTTADSNGQQKDEPQAEPAAEEPAEPEEEPAASYLSTLSVEELYAYLTKLDDNNFAAAWQELTDSQKAEYNAYVLKMTFGDNKTTTSYEGGGAAASMTNVAGLVSNLAASQKALRNSPARAARAAVQAAKDVELSNDVVKPVNGLHMNKWITKKEPNTADTEYTIHLESYTTGKTTTTYSSKPCDIVLVLDQSGSMANPFTKVTYTEKKFEDTALNSEAYKYKDNLYVKATVGEVKDKHIPVKVTRTVTEAKDPSYYSAGSRKLENLVDSVKTGEYYYRDYSGNYHLVSEIKVDRYLFGTSYTLVLEDGTNPGVEDNAWVTLYTKTDNNNYSYTYSYELEGKTYSVTIEGNDSKIPSAGNQKSFFATGVERHLYYAEKSTNDTNDGYTRLDGLKDAVNQFVSSVESDATTSGVDHNIAIVGFGSYPKDKNERQNTEILTGVDISTDQWGYKNGEAYKGNGYNTATANALQSAKTQEGKNSIAGAIDALDANGATRTDRGITMANDIFKAKVESDPSRYEGGKRNKVVVVFTDGEPNNFSGFDSSYATEAIKAAKTLKGDNATVYTIGIFDNADASPITSSTTKMNRFMHYVSSNYPQADSMDYKGTSDKLGYYLTAADSAALNEIFSKIASEIGSSDVALNTTTQTIDKMSAEFKLPAGFDETKVNVCKVPCTGFAEDGTPIFDDAKKVKLDNPTITVGADTVSVSGFDYSTDYVDKTSNKGYKLLIEFPVEYKNDAWFGGNNIKSNDVGSGIYHDGDCKGTFKVPEVNRVIDYKIAAKDQTIYVTNKADLKGLLGYFQTAEGKSYEPDGTKNRYVNITYTLKDAADKEVGTFIIKAGQTATQGTWESAESADGQTWNPELEDCTTYTWTCTVKPISEGKDALGIDGLPNNPATPQEYGKDGKTKGTVHVLYPTVAVRDEKIYWGETVKLVDLVENTGNWKDRSSDTGIPDARPSAPTVTVTSTCVAGDNSLMPAKDGAYTVTVKVADKDITGVVREMDGITNTKPVEHTEWNCDDHKAVDDKKTYDFCIHVKSKELTVIKKVEGNMGDTKKEFEFTGVKIYDANKDEVKNSFELKHDGSQTFKLKVGDKVSIRETSVAGYETSYEVSDGTNGKDASYTYGEVTKKSPDKVTVTYTNKKQINPPNGIITTIAPYAIMVVLAAGAGVYFVYSRRRRNH